MDDKWKRQRANYVAAVKLHRFPAGKVLSVLLLSSLICLLTGANELQPVQLIPRGIDSINGSSDTMGCPVVVNISGTRKGCGGCGHYSPSLLLDGVSPSINTSASDWASQLVTVRKNDAIAGKIDFPHALLGFSFDVPVSPSSIELDLFHCPDWNIGATHTDVYSNNNANLSFTISVSPRGFASAPKPSCDSLSTILVPITKPTFNASWYVVMTFEKDSAVQWAHIGEVRFLNLSEANNSSPTCNRTFSAASSVYITSTVVATSSLSPSLNLTSTRVSPSRSSQTSVAASQTTLDLDASIRVYATVFPIVTKVSVPDVRVPLVTSTPYPTKTIPLKFIFIAGAASLVLLVLSLAIILCCVAFRCRSRVRHKIVVDSDLNGGAFTTFQPQPLPPTPVESPTCNGHHPISTANALLLSADISMVYRHSQLYESIPAEQPYARLNENKEPNGTDATYSAEAPTAKCPPCDGAGVPQVYVANACDTELLVPSTTNAETLDSQDTYVAMKSPYITASPDVEQILRRRIIVNEGIYSERIDPSDFTITSNDGQESETSTEFEFLAPVYPTLSTMPEGFKPIVEVSGENIKETGKLRVGQFGQTLHAITLDLSLKSIGLNKMDDNRNISLVVAVKKLCPRSHFEREAFNRETQFLSQLRHPNVLRFLGVCHYTPSFIMMEYVEEGDLNVFLRKYSEIVPIVTPSSKNQVTTSTLVYIASQIANAMRYLAELNFIHRDLSTRNCYIGANTVVKVGDLGVDMTLYRSHYFPIHGKTLLPIRWMATECFSGKFSEKSDVWAFGVTMWELFTLAKDLPYPHLSDEEVIHNALSMESCQLPSKPLSCTQPVFEVIERCWVLDMKYRATFAELHKLLQMHL